MSTVRIQRVYAEARPEDGRRFLVDRVWPRGVSKERAAVEAWLPSVAPSTELRRWFDHDPVKWDGFRQRYFAELDAGPEDLERLLDAARGGPVTLVYSARDEAHNQAAALREYLTARLA